MLASIVIASYNHADYIAACLNSLRGQTFENIELVIIDDCSSDDSFSIIQSVLAQPPFRSRFKRILCERNPSNLGAAATWNRAIARASGDLIFLINSDDAYGPARVETFMNDWRQRPVYFGFSHMTPIDGRGQEVVTAAAAEIKYRPRRLLRKVLTPSWALLDFNLTITTGNFVFTRRTFEAVGGFSDLKLCHDWSFALRAATLVEPSVIDSVHYFYRLHAANSFLQLTARADEEVTRCYQDYAALAVARRPPNPRCLSPYNQGPAFSNLVRLMPVFQYWLSQYDQPYQSHHRTIAPGPYTTGSHRAHASSMLFNN